MLAPGFDCLQLAEKRSKADRIVTLPRSLIQPGEKFFRCPAAALGPSEEEIVFRVTPGHECFQDGANGYSADLISAFSARRSPPPLPRPPAPCPPRSCGAQDPAESRRSPERQIRRAKSRTGQPGP